MRLALPDQPVQLLRGGVATAAGEVADPLSAAARAPSATVGYRGGAVQKQTRPAYPSVAWESRSALQRNGPPGSGPSRWHCLKTANLFHAGPSMSTINDLDPDALISRLAGPLSPADRAAFRAAAEDALSRVPCLGEGSLYRAVALEQRRFFDPPPDRVASWRIEREFGPSKLRDAPAIEHAGDGRHVRYRKHAR